jgi:phosphocarrier protein
LEIEDWRFSGFGPAVAGLQFEMLTALRGVFSTVLIKVEMEVQTFTIRNRLGLHARVAALLVKTANHFVSEITLEKDGLEVNGKSIMGILMLAASKGSKITLKAEGKDAAQAIKTLGELIENRFGEE